MSTKRKVFKLWGDLGNEVELVLKSDGVLGVKAYNEGGYNWTYVPLADLFSRLVELEAKIEAAGAKVPWPQRQG